MRISVADHRRGAGAGFSMIEMLVAVAILGMVATAGVMAIGSRDVANLRREANDLAMTLNRARLDSARLGRTVTLKYDARRHALVTESSELKIARSVTIRNMHNNSNRFEVRMSPSGISGGLFAALSSGDNMLWVTLDPLTGRVGLHTKDPQKRL